jgi:hypothetical protein
MDDDYQLVKVDHTPSVQLDVTQSFNKTFKEEDCDVFGEEGMLIGVKLCISTDESRRDLLRSGRSTNKCLQHLMHYPNHAQGLFVCDGIDEGECDLSSRSLPNITMISAFHTRQVTFIAARSNWTITSVVDKTPPLPFVWNSTDFKAYREVYRWLLNYTSAGIPAPSSFIEPFWSSKTHMLNAFTSGILSQNFHGLLAYPFWLFNENNWSNVETQDNITTLGLPEQFYTRASFLAPYEKLKFDRGMFILYIVLQGQAMVFVWCILLLVICGRGGKLVAKTTEFPMFDVAIMCQIRGPSGRGIPTSIPNPSTSEVIALMRDHNIRAI